MYLLVKTPETPTIRLLLPNFLLTSRLLWRFIGPKLPTAATSGSPSQADSNRINPERTDPESIDPEKANPEETRQEETCQEETCQEETCQEETAPRDDAQAERLEQLRLALKRQLSTLRRNFGSLELVSVDMSDGIKIRISL